MIGVKPSQSSNWGRRPAWSASRHPSVCYPFLRLSALLDSDRHLYS